MFLTKNFKLGYLKEVYTNLRIFIERGQVFHQTISRAADIRHFFKVETHSLKRLNRHTSKVFHIIT